MATRYNKTLADYLVIAVSPALIMTLVGSLVYFLLELFYQGNFNVRLHYILSLFIFAAVLIGRISIEDGRERAALFALPLAGATLYAIFRFVQFQGALLGQFSFLINFGLIALIWWCADRLTWDCTMIDEDESASGEGLLDAAGLGERPVGWDKQTGWVVALRSRLARFAKSHQSVATLSHPTPSAGPTQRTPRNKPHAPGVWVVYFSLAALPLFGLGQLAIPVAQESRRRYAFCLLAIYVASGLGLLLTTSFLGLRRYLRQRRLPMPVVMAGTWIALGCVLIFVVMGLALLLPRPNAEFAVSQLPRLMGSPDQKPSQHAVGDEGVKSDQPGRPVPNEKGKPGESNQSGGQPADKAGQVNAKNGNSDDGKQGSGKPDQGKKDGKQESSESGRDKTSGPRTTGGEGRQQGKGDTNKPSGREESKRDTPPQQGTDQGQKNQSSDSQGDKEKPRLGTQSEKPPGAGQAPRPPESRAPQFQPPPMDFSSAFSWLLPFLQYGFYILLVGLAVFWAWRHRAAILAAIRDLLAGIGSLWERLWGGRKKTAQGAAEADRAPPPHRPFADFADPFSTGMAARVSSDRLVRYLFEALEAWAAEEGCPRAAEQTPHEFARNVASHTRALRHLSTNLADLYCEAAYAPGRLRITDEKPLQELWRALHARPVAPSQT